MPETMESAMTAMKDRPPRRITRAGLCMAPKNCPFNKRWVAASTQHNEMGRQAELVRADERLNVEHRRRSEAYTSHIGLCMHTPWPTSTSMACPPASKVEGLGIAPDRVDRGGVKSGQLDRFA